MKTFELTSGRLVVIQRTSWYIDLNAVCINGELLQTWPWQIKWKRGMKHPRKKVTKNNNFALYSVGNNNKNLFYQLLQYIKMKIEFSPWVDKPKFLRQFSRRKLSQTVKHETALSISTMWKSFIKCF